MAVKLVLNNFSLVGKTLFGQSKDQGVKSFGLVISFQQTFLLHRIIFCLFFFYILLLSFLFLLLHHT